jgi:phosphonate transport system permease protein
MISADLKKELPEWKRFKYPQSLYKYFWLTLLVLFFWHAPGYLNIDLIRFSGLLDRFASVIANRYWPPDVEHISKSGYLLALIDTFQMSYVATVLGVFFAVPLAWFGSFNITPSKRVLYPIARFFVMTCRSVHEMIWTILLVAIVGYGMLPGTLALTLFCIGFAGKLMSESIESIPMGQVEAIRSSGANQLQVFIFAVLPQVRVAWTGIIIYTWDVVFRAATVVGYFGAGGVGFYLRESVERIETKQVCAIILSIIFIVVLAELFSAWIRKKISNATA